MEFIQIEVQAREARGKANMRRLRRSGTVPGVLYGLNRRNLPLSVPDAELRRFLKTGSHLVELRMGDQTRPAILRELQMDPLSEDILHVDFVRVDADTEVQDHIPVVFKGTAIGATQGGLFQRVAETLHLSARPRDIPQEIVIDIAALGVGDAIYAKDVDLPSGVSLAQSPDDMVAHVVVLREAAVAEPEEEGEPKAAEPEVIGKPAEAEAEEAQSAEGGS
ncbi:MAG: 50S ribosomal protein L25 [Planctomycetota bacterium]|jgi:large subunit ribosomal protein L25